MILATPNDQEVVENELGGFQLLMKRWSTLHPYNVVDFIELPGSFDLARLTRAAGELTFDWGIGRIELDAYRRLFRYVPADSPVRVRAMKGTGSAALESLLGHASRELNTPFERDGRLPIRLFGMQTGKRQWLSLTYEHWIADGYSGASLFLNIARRYLGKKDCDWAVNDRRVRRPAAALVDRLGPGFYVRHAASTVAKLLAFRSYYSPHFGEREDLHVDVHGVPLERDALGRIIAVSRRWKVTVNDILMAVLARAVAEALPDRLTQRRRRRLALTCIADLRQLSHGSLERAMGVYLGYFHVLLAESLPSSLEDLVTRIHAQTAHAKESGASVASLGEIAYCNAAWPLLSRAGQVRHFMNNHPAAAGISNLRLPPPWLGGDMSDVPIRYLRAVPTGMMTPLALGVTTARDELAITLTARRAGLRPPQIQIVRESLADQIASL